MMDATDIAELQVMMRQIRDLLRDQQALMRRAVELLESSAGTKANVEAMSPQRNHVGVS